MIRTPSQRFFSLIRAGGFALIAFVAFSELAGVASAQVTAAPIAGITMGLAPGTTAVCAGALDAFGDGCPATQASLVVGVGGTFTDAYGNIYVCDYANFRLRIIYRGGGTAAAIIVANNPMLTGAPQVGYVYTISGPGTGSLVSPNYYCGGSIVSSGPKGIDILGDGCLAYNAYTKPTSGGVDADGDIFYMDHSHSTTDVVRVVYGGGVAAAKLIALESGVSSPILGYIYRVGGPAAATSGYSGDGSIASSGSFNGARSLILDSKLDIFIADTTNNVVRRIDGTTGFLSAYAGGAGTGCALGTKASCKAAFAGDGGPATAASLSAPYETALDANGNLYIADSGNGRVRVVYAAGNLPSITGPVAGNIYTVAGGGTATASGSAALSIALSTPRGVSFDAAGNLYIAEAGAGRIWRVDVNGVAVILAGPGPAPAAGAFCNGSAGPKATDTLGDGCPALEATLNNPLGHITFDLEGIGYVSDSNNALVRSFTVSQRFVDTQVGSSSNLTLAFTSPTAFVTPTIAATPAEFTVTSDNCVAGAALVANAICTYTVKFSPVLPGKRVGSITAASTSFTSGLALGVEGKGLSPLLGVATSVSSTAASTVKQPTSVTADGLGNLYISDASTSSVLKGSAGGTFVAVGTGFSKPGQTALDGLGNLYVADTGNNRLAEISAGVTTTLIAGLSAPVGVAASGRGVVYVSDAGNNRVLRYEAGTVTTVPLMGLSGPAALALGADGTLYVADTGNGRIVTYTTLGVQSTVILSSTIQPVGLAVDAANDVFFADALSASVYRLPSGSTAAVTLAGSLQTPGGIGLEGSGNFYYTDSTAGSVTKIAQANAAIAFAKTQIGDQSAAQTLTLNNIGNQALTFNSSSTYAATGDTADFAITQGSNACGAGPIAAGGSCTLNAVFQPIAVAQYSETLTFPSNAPGAASVALTGTGVFLVKTSLLISLTSPTTGGVSYGQNAVFSATITPATVSTALSGNIVVRVDGANPQTISIAGASTSFTLSLAPGTHSISVTYSGDNVYASSFGTYSLTVTKQSTSTTLSYTSVTQTATPSLTLIAKVTGLISGTPTQTVTFYNGTTAIGTATLSSGGVATLTTKTVSYPAYTFTAVYSGDTNYATSTSSSVTVGGDFGVTALSSTLTTAAGVATSTTVTLTPYFGYSGTVSFSCTGMPAAAACRFTPQTLALSGGVAQTTSIQFYSNLAPTLSAMHRSSAKVVFAFTLLPAMLLLGLRRRRKLSGLPALMLLAVLSCLAAGAITGCSDPDSFPTGTTPAGTSTVVMTASDGSVSHTATFSLSIFTN